MPLAITGTRKKETIETGSQKELQKPGNLRTYEYVKSGRQRAGEKSEVIEINIYNFSVINRTKLLGSGLSNLITSLVTGCRNTSRLACNPNR